MIKLEIFSSECPMATEGAGTTDKLSIQSQVFRMTFLVCQCEACRKTLGLEKAKTNTFDCDLVAITKDHAHHIVDTWLD